MLARIVVALALLAGCAAAEGLCNMPTDAYPPAASTALPWHTVDLDAPAADRWTQVVTPLGKQIHDMVYSVIEILGPKLGPELLSAIDAKKDDILAHFPQDYGAEIAGIAKAIDMDPAALILYNVAYELEGACTSMVARDANNQLYHARNLDFGLFFGWDKANNTWQLAEKLRPLLFNAKIMKGGQNIYNGTYFGGFVGLLTGAKKGGFSITVDTRFDDNLDRGLFQWFHGDYSAHFVAFTTREAMENNATYADALQTLNNTNMIGPSYMILGGVKPTEGAIITREEAKSLNLWTLQNDLHKTGFFVLETNYDHWKNAPFFDDRRQPAEECLAKLGPQGVSFKGLFNVLSGRPNLNMLTTYTTLMSVATGEFEAYRQVCDWPCPPW